MKAFNETTGLHLLDLVALVVGYGLASVLMRAFWPDGGQLSVGEYLLVGLVYAWLGLAMSGPVVLMIRRPTVRDPAEDERPDHRSWSELAWMIIGYYWIGLTVLVVPIRLNGTRFVDSAVLGVFPVLAALGLRFFGPRHLRKAAAAPSWTHRAACGLLASWPFVWVGLILLGKTF